jgi:CheY-like chemotaxis protein
VGATILGDGSVTPVLDLPELLRVAHQSSDELSVSSVANTKERPTLPCALVVDDSLSARRALAQFIADSGFEVHTARDGMEAVQLIEQRRPDILLADLEMPRMNGVELTSHICAQSTTAKLPVIMITSRTASKHRQQAEAAGVNVYIKQAVLGRGSIRACA